MTIQEPVREERAKRAWKPTEKSKSPNKKRVISITDKITPSERSYMIG